MSYLVLARKWRPSTFDNLVGQEHVLKPLTHALEQNRLHHAYLFTGTRGVGKTTIARIFAKSLNCLSGITASPCNTCEHCTEINAGRFIDLIEVDAASRTKVEDTRELLDNLQYAPTKGRYKVYLIDEVHMLSSHSFNALLKSLEEPPPHVIFLFATTDPDKIPVTVLSRCLQFYLRHLRTDEITAHLAHILKEEAVEAEPEALTEIAQAARGSVRDALSITDQAICFGEGKVDLASVTQLLRYALPADCARLFEALVTADIQAVYQIIDDLAAYVDHYAAVLDNIATYSYDLSLYQQNPDIAKTRFNANRLAQLEPLSEKISPAALQVMYQIAIKGAQDIEMAPSPKVGFEMTCLRILNFIPLSFSSEGLESPSQASTSARPSHSAPQAEAKKAISRPAERVFQEAKYVPASPGSGPHSQEAKHVPASPVSSAQPVSEGGASTAAPLAAGGLSQQWRVLVQQLKLPGMAGKLLQHCVPVQLTADLVSIGLAPEHAGLLNDRIKKVIRQALINHYSPTCRLDIHVQGEAPEQTPASEASVAPIELARADAKKARSELEARVAADKHVQQLQETFGADLDLSTIKAEDA